MNFFDYPTPYISSSLSFERWVERTGNSFTSRVSAALGNLLYVFFTFILVVVGSALGAITGAILSQGTKSGFLRKAAVGSIMGAIFAIDVFEYSCGIWQADITGIPCFYFLINVIMALPSNILVEQQVDLATQSTVQSQMATEPSLEQVLGIFHTGEEKGLSGDLVQQIPKIKITTMNSRDSSGEKILCSVCLQDFQNGETVRSLPNCYHMFHLPCIDKWLVQNGSCPFCRRHI